MTPPLCQTSLRNRCYSPGGGFCSPGHPWAAGSPTWRKSSPTEGLSPGSRDAGGEAAPAPVGQRRATQQWTQVSGGDLGDSESIRSSKLPLEALSLRPGALTHARSAPPPAHSPFPPGASPAAPRAAVGAGCTRRGGSPARRKAARHAGGAHASLERDPENEYLRVFSQF